VTGAQCEPRRECVSGAHGTEIHPEWLKPVSDGRTSVA
jgi:hypothetical protein